MRAYRWLLLVFPERIRREFGADMTALLAAQLEHARSAGEAVWWIWCRAILDALRFGLIEHGSDAMVRVRSVGRELRRWRWWMRAFTQDLGHALRMMVRQPAGTIVAVITLAIGIGANTAIFSAVDTFLLRPLPYDEPDRLAMVWESRPAEGVYNNFVAPADYLDWARMNTVFESMAAFSPVALDLTGAGEPVRLTAGAVTLRFFDVLRSGMALGRSFTGDESAPGGRRAAILSHGLWQRRFGSDPAIVGRTLALNGAAVEVVGVLPPGFEFPDGPIDLWVPAELSGPDPPSRADHDFKVYARLRPGVTLEQARRDMESVGLALSRQYPGTNRRHGAAVRSLTDELTTPIRTPLLLLLSGVAFVLLMACINVANLLMARAAGRRRELGIRAALGAGRARLAGQALTESLLLGLIGAGAGLVVAWWGIGLLRAIAPANVPLLGVPQLGLDWRVLAFSLVLALVSSVLFGLLPAWHFGRHDAIDAMRDASRRQGTPRRGIRLALVVSEIALASLLLVAAGLALRSFRGVLQAESGLRTTGTVTATVALPSSRYPTEGSRVAEFEAIEARIRAIPGVDAVGATSALPLSGQDGRRGVGIEGFVSPGGAPTRAHVRSVTPGYFRAMGIGLAAGRSFSDADRAGSLPVVVVNETMARRYWPDRSPLGKRVGLSDGVWREVVGIVRDVRHWGMERAINPEMYFPLGQGGAFRMTLVAATAREGESVAADMRAALAKVNQDLPLSDVRTIEDVVARSVAPRRASVSIVGAFGVMALLLAAAGIYGVMSHLVALRTGEIGVRLAMGANRRDILRLILGEGLVHALLGLLIGLGAAAVVMQWVRAYLYGVGPIDPATLAGVAILLLATTLLACFLPARRAMNVDPVTAVRE
jgi:putative ABC transport system permease protein